MKLQRIIRGRGYRSVLLLGLIALLRAFLSRPRAALAHPHNEYLQATYITIAPSQIIVEQDLTPGLLSIPHVLKET